jgi:hypothetical protein
MASLPESLRGVPEVLWDKALIVQSNLSSDPIIKNDPFSIGTELAKSANSTLLTDIIYCISILKGTMKNKKVYLHAFI